LTDFLKIDIFQSGINRVESKIFLSLTKTGRAVLSSSSLKEMFVKCRQAQGPKFDPGALSETVIPVSQGIFEV